MFASFQLPKQFVTSVSINPSGICKPIFQCLLVFWQNVSGVVPCDKYTLPKVCTLVLFSMHADF